MNISFIKWFLDKGYKEYLLFILFDLFSDMCSIFIYDDNIFLLILLILLNCYLGIYIYISYKKIKEDGKISN